MPTRGVHLPPELAAIFDQKAASHGGTSRVLRRLIDDFLLVEGGGAACVAARDKHQAAGLKVTLRLKPDLLAALDDAAAERGVPRATWMKAVVAARLLGRPELSGGEATAYRLAHGELRRIGVNLNQIARAAHTAALEGTPTTIDLNTINAATKEIREIGQTVSDAFRGNLSYWKGE